MLYDKYQNKILRRARILQKIYKKLPIIITVLVILIVTAIAVTIAKGTVYGAQIPQSIEYGDFKGCKAYAFLSAVEFEYSPKGEENWNRETPFLPGDYDVRTVSYGSFGAIKYGNTKSFTIMPRKISVELEEKDVIYGIVPPFTADLGFEDTLVCEDFKYENIILKETRVCAETSSIKILDKNGNDVTYAYEISTPYCDVKIAPKKISILVEDAAHDYDGTVFKYEVYELFESELAKGDEIQANFTGSLTRPGTIQNTPQISIINESGHDVTHHYKIDTSKTGTITVNKRPLIITTGSLNVVYDGKTYSSKEYTIDPTTSLLPGHILVAGDILTLTNAGTIENTRSFKVLDEKTGTNVTRLYSVIVNVGEININRRPATITTGSSSWLYDGEEHAYTRVQSEGLLQNHFVYTYRVNYASIINAGKIENVIEPEIIDRFSGDSVIDNYDITYNYGTLEVRKRKINITTVSKTWVYDTLPHYSTETTVTGDGLLKNHKITGSQMPSITEVGSVENVFIAEIVRDFEKLTSNYEITYDYGTLTVEPRSITIAPVDVKKVYDGTPLYATEAKIVEGTLAYGHDIQIEVEGSATTVADSETEKSVVSSYSITCNGEDISDNYNVILEEGLLIIEPRTIMVTSGSAEKVYDGTPLTSNEIIAVEDVGSEEELYTLLPGHIIYGDITGSQTNIGKTKNTYDINSLVIKNGEEDVTENYMFHAFEYGFLLVKYPETSYGKIKADASGPIYLRMASFGNYSLSVNSLGKFWTEATPYISSTYSPNAFTAEALSKTFDEMYKAEFSGMQTYMQPYYSYVTDSNKIKITTDTDYSAIDPTKPYSVEFYKVPNLFDRLLSIKKNAVPNAAEEEYRKYVYENYLFIDSFTREYMNSIIQKESFKADDEDIVKRVAVYIQNSAKYELYYDSALDGEENVVIAFLEEYKAGNCTHYASAATLLFRALGIPARYVEGFYVEAVEGEEVEIKNPSHAWVEIYLDGIGWVYVEVTGGMKNGFDTGLYEGEKLPTGFTVQPLAYKHKFTGSAFYPENKIEEFGDLKKLLDRGYTYTVEVSGSQLEIGASATAVTAFTLFDPNGNDVTDEFDIEYLNGEIEVCENPISIYLYEIRKYYDAKDIIIDENGYKIMTPLADGITLELDFHINLKNVGEITRSELNINTEEYVTYKVYSNGTDVTRGYTLYFDIHESITDTAGYIPISIKPRQIEITSGTAVKMFDGAPLTNDDFYISIGSLVEGDTITTMIDGEQIKIGRSENKIVSATVIDKDGNNVTDNYKIVPKSGILTVLDPAA